MVGVWGWLGWVLPHQVVPVVDLAGGPGVSVISAPRRGGMVRCGNGSGGRNQTDDLASVVGIMT